MLISFYAIPIMSNYLVRVLTIREAIIRINEIFGKGYGLGNETKTIISIC